MRTQEVRENSTFVRNVSFVDRSGSVTAPVSARYRVDCLTTKQIIRDWTDLPAAASTQLVFNQVDNEIKGYQDYERRQCVVESTDSDGNTMVNTFDWRVKNLQGVS